jgi:Mg2+/Co2+ transporter CorB
MEIFLFLILILISAFFSASETAIFSLSKFKLHSLVRENKPGADALAKLKADPNKLLATILIGNNLVNVFIASLATLLITQAVGSLGVGIATGVVTILLLIFADNIPKGLAAHRPVSMALFAARPLLVLSIVLAPAVFVLERISDFFTDLFSGDSIPAATEEELKSAIAISQEVGVLQGDAAEMMKNVIEFEDVKVGEVMTPELSVVYLDGDKPLKEVLNTIIQSDYSRFPVYEGNEERIVGVFESDIVLRAIEKGSLDKKLKEFVVEAYIVPEGKKVADLLRDFAKDNREFALVVDEHGSFTGVVSMEDVLEEIVGDIFDKSLKIDRLVRPGQEKGTLQIEASARVSDLERLLHVSLKGEGFTTLSGLIQHQIGRIPKKGEKIRLKGFEIAIEEADEKSIKRVLLYKLPS